MQKKGKVTYEVVGGPHDGKRQERKDKEIMFGLRPSEGEEDTDNHYYRLARCDKTDQRYWTYVGTDVLEARDSKRPKIKLNP